MTEAGKQLKYNQLLKEAAALLDGENDTIANMANLAALIHESMGFWWTGFYIVRTDANDTEQLVLGPFQGPIACTRIAFGRGVCGTSWQRRETVIVPDVEQFPGHIACSSQSRSEIVVPVFKDDAVTAVLDIDSQYLNTFDKTDARYLERIVRLLNRP
ncbi:MAG: GAF domain-containing protein [Bacteroidaceae bacterium]|nr:GAF domain-containing protein [Bacteroidaceae bacterium]